jgi:hypothetical protein
MKKTTITVSMLNDHKACQEQIERFRKCFGESVKVTVRRAPSVANEFEWDLAAGYFLRGKASKEYEKKKFVAETKYQSITGPVWATYQAAKSFAKYAYDSSIALADKIYDRHEIEGYANHARYKRQAWAQYQGEVSKAWKECRAVKVPALRRYEKELAVAFVRCVKKYGITGGSIEHQ